MSNNYVAKAAQEYRGNLIAHGRKVKGLTQEQLAALVGVSTMSIRRYENGERAVPKDVLKRISDVLGDIFKDDTGVPGFREWLKRKVEDDTVLLKKADAILLEAEALKHDMSEIDLLTAYRKLNTSGQRVAVERVQELTLIPQYQRTETATDNAQANTPHTTEKPSEGK